MHFDAAVISSTDVWVWHFLLMLSGLVFVWIGEYRLRVLCVLLCESCKELRGERNFTDCDFFEIYAFDWCSRAAITMFGDRGGVFDAMGMAFSS